MRSWRAFSETIHLTVLGLWLGALVMTGAAAAIIFPTMRDLNPTLPQYSGYTGEHWLIAAGQPASRLFLACDLIQFVAALLSIISLVVIILVCKLPMRRASSIIRFLALVAAVGVLGYYSFVVAPRMQINMRGYWEAALQGNSAEAAKFKAVFDADHPVASNLMGAIAIAVFFAMVAGAWSATTSGVAAPVVSEPVIGKPSRYEEPALLRSRR